MPLRHGLRGLLALCLCLGFSTPARSAVYAAWETVINGGPSEYFSSAQGACQRQHDSFAPQAPGPVTATPYENWEYAACDWITHLDGGPYSPLPASVASFCVDDSAGTPQRAWGYKLIPPGACVPADEPYASREVCDAGASASGSPRLAPSSLPGPVALDPIILSTGALQESATDYEDADGRLRIARSYRSRHGAGTFWRPGFGAGDLWRFSFQWEWWTDPAAFASDGFGIGAPDGSDYRFQLRSDGTIVSLNNGVSDVSVQYLGSAPVNHAALLDTGGSFLITTRSGDRIEMALYRQGAGTRYTQGHPVRITWRGGYSWQFSYGSKGELQRVDDSLGRSFTVTWHSSANADFSGVSYPRAISAIALPDGTSLSYDYDGYAATQTYARLKTVTRRQGGVTVDATSYRYENTRMPFLLTGLVDNAGIRHGSWTYDNAGRALSASHDQGVDAGTVSYASPGGGVVTRTVTNALGKQTTYSFMVRSGDALLTSVTGAPTASCVGTTATNSYDSGNRRSSSTDTTGSITQYSYDSAGNPATVTEAFGTPLQRVSTTTWNTSFGVPTRIVRPGLTTDLSYDSTGRLTAVTKTDTTTHTTPYATNGRTRSWTYSYNSQGLLAQVDGPLAGLQDAVLLSYDSKGYLQGTVNGLWHQWLIAARDNAGRRRCCTNARSL